MLFTLSQTESSYAVWLNFKIKKHKGRRKTFPRSWDRISYRTVC